MKDQYERLLKRVVDEGVWTGNERTGNRCLTIINADHEYDVGAGKLPLVTTRKVNGITAIMEMLGYLRGYDSAEQFRKLGCKTWDANANENKDWLNNSIRKGIDDMGRVYGVQGRNWMQPDGTFIDQLKKVVNNLSKGIDDRGEIITFWNPGEFHLGCLRPCMFMHQFSLLEDTLHLNSYQRSCDLPLGGVFNQVQVYFLLAIVAQITGHKPGKAYHKMVNVHIYENQIDLVQKQLEKDPFPVPELKINPEIKSLEDLETWVGRDDFEIINYQHHEPISYPFSV